MRLILIVRVLQAIAILGLFTALAQGLVEAVFDPTNGLRPGLPPVVPTTTQSWTERVTDPVSRTVMRMVGPGMLLVLCEIAVILDRRLPTHSDDAS